MLFFCSTGIFSFVLYKNGYALEVIPSYKFLCFHVRTCVKFCSIPDLKQKHDDDTLGLDVIDELHESLQSVMNMWKEFATAFNKDLRLDGKILDAIQAAQGERKLQMVLGFLMGKITKLDIHEVLQNLQEQAEFAKQWEQLYLHEDGW